MDDEQIQRLADRAELGYLPHELKPRYAAAMMMWHFELKFRGELSDADLAALTGPGKPFSGGGTAPGRVFLRARRQIATDDFCGPWAQIGILVSAVPPTLGSPCSVRVFDQGQMEAELDEYAGLPPNATEQERAEWILDKIRRMPS